MTNRTIAELVSHLKHLDVQLFVEGDRQTTLDNIRLRCNAPEGILTQELRQELLNRKAELVSYLDQENASQSLTLNPHVPIPLSFAQQRLWFLYQLAPNNPFYNVPAAIRLKGELDQTALERSLHEIVRRHAALRTTFTTLDGQPVQVIQPNGEVDFSVVNLQTVAMNDRDRMSQQLAIAEAQRPFNLTTDSLLRVTLLQFSSNEAMLLLTMHHIVADGWSLGVLIRELACFYTAFVEGRSPGLAPLPLQYVDFSQWQRNWLQGDVLEKQLTYWRKQLQDLPGLELPSDHPRPAVQSYRGATYPLQMSPTLTQSLDTLSQQAGVSLFMLLLAAFQTLLYRYTGQTDIPIGSPIANRHHSELEGLIGFFVNSLVLRTSLAGNPTFRELLERVRNVALEAYEHQDLPFEKLVEELDPDRDLSRNPLFQVAFALQNAPMQALELPGLILEPAPLESGSTRFDLEVHLWEPTHGLRSLWKSQEGLSGFISYSTDLFDRDRIARLIGHFQTILEGIVANPDTRLSDLPLLTPAERQQIFGEWSRPSLDVSPISKGEVEITPGSCFHHIFEAQVQNAPAAIALVTEQGSLTYGELNQKANYLAQTLRHMGVEADSLVGLCVDRSTEMVIGILGILKAGGAYVPLDPNSPSDRLHFMLTDTQVAILLTQSRLVESLPASQAQLLCLDELAFSACDSSPHQDDRDLTITPDHLAYVIYTSGSTGTPKGVLLTHRGLFNVVAAQQQIFHLSPNSRVLQFSSLSFDASVFEIALALGSGGTLYIPPKSAQLPGMALLQFMQEAAITHALLTPAVLSVLPAAQLSNLQVLITGGEACSSQVIDRWPVDRHFFNAYGPTEITIWATVAELHPGDHPLTIGRPILNTQVYILDANLNPVPVGIAGELYIAGAGLARGYLNRPDLTAERFIERRWNEPCADSQLLVLPRLYKTGDRARYRRDGTLEFLGRVDHQIKIRGFRVELGEIEATLQRHPAIQEAAVIPTEEASSEMRLVAYFSLNSHYLSDAIVRSLQTQHLQHWQTLYNQTYQPSSQPPTTSTPNPQFNITGWNSSYTGEPIPLEQMQAWVSDRVQQILALKPRRVLEIGCGTGLLLFQIAPHCQTYVGTDFSAVSLAEIQPQLESLHLTQVKLLHRMATDFEGIESGSFDVVILNSIVQYFPSADYLMQVIEGAIQAVAPGGVLFIGDVRSLPLLTAFHTWMQFCQADANLEQDELQQRVERSQFEEPELAIDPAFFHAIRDRFSHIRQVQIRLSRGRSHNEMMQFRYNVLLHVAGGNDALRLHLTYSTKYDWKVNPITVEAVKENLIQTQPKRYLITNITNSRVHSAIRTVNWIRNKESPKTVGRMRDGLKNATGWAIDPQDWWDLETVLPYRVEITWSSQTDTGDYDVLFIHQDLETIVDEAMLPSDISSPLKSVSQYTNNPLQSNVARQLIPELRQHLKQTLLDYMIPSAFVPLEALPLTTSGKIDRRRLPILNNDLIHSPNEITTDSLTQTEIALIDIWKDLLRTNHVSTHDNFFELGGHSLLATQMTSRVRDTFKLELPLKSIFEAPTIAQLAPFIETLRNTTSNSKVPPLIRLDRSAYRRKRETLSVNHASTQTAPTQNEQHKTLTSDSLITEFWSPLIPLTLGDSQQPFFCVHPMFGVVFPYLELAHLLKSPHSFYGLQPLGLDGKSPPLNRIEAIAAYYIQAIQTLQPHGPYLLGGWSFGGLVAFEMAQQLTQKGEDVQLLAMLDTIAPCNTLSFCQTLKFFLETALWSTLPFLLDYGTLAADRLQFPKAWISRWQWSAVTRLIPEESRLRLFDESAVTPLLRLVHAHSQATYHYTPQPYPHCITLFRAADQPKAIEPDSTLGWKNLSSNVQVHSIPGNHLSLLQQPHVQVLAKQLRPYLS